MSSAVAEAWQFITSNKPAVILRRIRAREVPWLIQFAVYGVCGVLATVVFVGLVLVFSSTIFPAMDGMIVDGKPITDALRAKNLLINNTLAFLIANVVAYVSNILLVFKGGRHHPVMEFLYFTAVSGVGFILSQLAGPWLIHQFGVPTYVAILTNTIASMMINFVCRKFFVFKG